MAFKRAMWKSGLTYQQTCRSCGTTVQYMDDKLDFRPWYADGFVYCPVCRTPLRHNEQYAINGVPGQAVAAYPKAPTTPQPSVAQAVTPQIQQEPQNQPLVDEQTIAQQAESISQSEPAVKPLEKPVQTVIAEEKTAFCSNCGKAYREGDNFCSACGKKR